MTNESVLAFNLPKNQSSVIKVIGVGGGGSNAVNYMFHHGIEGVDFAVCNTDLQALESSPIPNKIQIGAEITEGLGAGANPEVGRKAAEESIERIEELLDSNTKMLFITAGMGGGTGTGAAPVIARVAREQEILTVGVVTVPFWTEGGHRKEYAQHGLEELRDNVDTLLVINNDKLIEVFGDLTLSQAFGKANEVLNTATKGIAEVISQTLMVNIDLNDAKRVLKNSGTAVMGQAYASGENRAIEAVEAALDSPLLNDNNIKGAQQVLLKIVTGTGEQEIRMTELFSIKKHIQDAAGCDVNIIEGIGVEDGLGDQISVTVIATGFEVKEGFGPRKPEPPKVFVLDDNSDLDVVIEESTTEDQPVFNEITEEAPQATINFEAVTPVINFDIGTEEDDQESEITEALSNSEEELFVEKDEVAPMSFEIKDVEAQEDDPVVHLLELDEMDTDANLPEEIIPDLKDEKEVSQTPINHGISAEQMAIRSRERMDRLRDISFKLRTPSGLTDLENEPAYKRRNIELEEAPHSSESEVAQYTLSEDNDNNVGIKPNNFLHDNVD
ncbi:MAG: cell division protein FtsZ [Flavobacteriales bacterium]|nr:cell division protein FtsZ [Flavobacteriales bacterium]